MYTRKAIGWFSLASMLLILAVAIDDWQLALLVLPIAAMFFLTNAFGFPETVELELQHRITPAETFGNEIIRIVLKVVNRGDARLENVEIEEALPAGIVPAKGTNHVYSSIQPKENMELSMELEAPGRGHYSIGPLTVRVRDSLGLYLSEKRLAPETLAVMPRPERIRGTELRPRHVGPWTGTIPSRAAGVGTEFFSLRDYMPGEDLKRVNWKATARSNRLILNEMEAERVTDIMVALDTDVSFYESSEREFFEQSVSAASSVASLLLRQGNRVGLILQGAERGIVPPGFGKRQEKRILYMLAAAKPGPAIIPTGYVTNLLARLMLPSRAQIVIVSPLLDPGITEGIRQLVMAGYNVTVLAPSAREPDEYVSGFERIAFKIARLERTNVLLAVEKMCTLIQWPAGVPLSRMLRENRRIRPRIRL